MILDLPNAGYHSMVSACGCLVIVQNVEIYNLIDSRFQFSAERLPQNWRGPSDAGALGAVFLPGGDDHLDGVS
ncbi:hypothetical protein D3C81_1717240 [compost metagenome]